MFLGPQNLALFVAQAKGYFDKHGIDADVQITVGSDEQRTALADGTVEFIHSAVDNAVHIVEAAGQDLIIVSGGNNGMNDHIVRAEINSYADLRGKTVVVDAANTAYAIQLYTLLAMNGVEEADYAVLTTGGAPQRLRAMGADENHAAYLLNPPSNFIAEEAGYRNFGTAVHAVGPYQADGAFVQRSWAEANSDAVVRYLFAGIEAIRWASDPNDRSEAAAILEKRLDLDPAIAVRSVDATIGPAGGRAEDARFDREGFQNMLRIRGKFAGTWGGNIPPPEKYIELFYYDRALAEL